MSKLSTCEPKILSLLIRKLHEGKTYEDFLNAWLPNKGAPEHYFPCPVYVINGQNLENPSEIISVGLIDCEEHELQMKWNLVQESENSRRRKVSKVSDTVSSGKIYKIKDIMQFGND